MKGKQLENTHRLELKILALKEGFRNRIAKISDEYEEAVAELRIGTHTLSEENNQLREENESLKNQLNELREETVVPEAVPTKGTRAKNSNRSN